MVINQLDSNVFAGFGQEIMTHISFLNDAGFVKCFMESRQINVPAKTDLMMYPYFFSC